MKAEEVVNTYYKKIYKLALYQLQDENEAEDLTHDIFFKVIKSLDSFENRSEVYTWVYRIALNTIKNYLRRKSIVRFLSIENDLRGFEKFFSVQTDDPAIKNEEKQEKVLKLKKLGEALQKLSSRERTAFFFFHYEKVKQKEIAEIMRTTVSAVESLIFKSMRKIKRYIA